MIILFTYILCFSVQAHNTSQVHPRISINALALIYENDQENKAYKELYKTFENRPLITDPDSNPIYWGNDKVRPSDTDADKAAYNCLTVIAT